MLRFTGVVSKTVNKQTINQRMNKQPNKHVVNENDAKHTISVMMQLTQFFPVSGSEHSSRIL